jgi:hypothetical protein
MHLDGGHVIGPEAVPVLQDPDRVDGGGDLPG